MAKGLPFYIPTAASQFYILTPAAQFLAAAAASVSLTTTASGIAKHSSQPVISIMYSLLVSFLLDLALGPIDCAAQLFYLASAAHFFLLDVTAVI